MRDKAVIRVEKTNIRKAEFCAVWRKYACVIDSATGETLGSANDVGQRFGISAQGASGAKFRINAELDRASKPQLQDLKRGAGTTSSTDWDAIDEEEQQFAKSLAEE